MCIYILCAVCTEHIPFALIRWKIKIYICVREKSRRNSQIEIWESTRYVHFRLNYYAQVARCAIPPERTKWAMSQLSLSSSLFPSCCNNILKCFIILALLLLPSLSSLLLLQISTDVAISNRIFGVGAFFAPFAQNQNIFQIKKKKR